MTGAEVDVVVIGGGVNGTGAARDLALRGLKVALFEKNDYGSGASGASSGMIHGGARYLTHEPAVTKLSCRDAGAVRRIAAHMIFRIPFIFPMVKGLPVQGMSPRLALHLTDSMLTAYDLYQPLKGGRQHQRLKTAEALELEPGLSPEVVGALTWDEWGIDAARLCLANALSAAEAGAEMHNHCRVLSFLRDEAGAVRGVEVADALEGTTREISCRAVLNAAGPWGELVAAEAGADLRLRPAKGVHLVIGGRVTNFAISAVAADGRIVFLEPWQDVTLVGTTDDDYYGDLDRLEASYDEVSYLLEAIETVFPSIRRHRVIDTWVGVRPTLWQYGTIEDRLSREHRVFDHSEEGAEGLFSLSGGKLAAFRLMAEEASDAICRFLEHDAPCRTAELPLPGSEQEVDIRKIVVEHDLSEALVRRLARRYGDRAGAALAPAGDEDAGVRLCRCQQVLVAEARYAVRQEQARTLDDLMRRTRLGAGPCGGLRCAHAAAELLASELVRPPSWTAAAVRRFLSRRYRARRSTLNGFQARAEVLGATFLKMHAPSSSGWGGGEA